MHSNAKSVPLPRTMMPVELRTGLQDFNCGGRGWTPNVDSNVDGANSFFASWTRLLRLPGGGVA
jgi:hypothetical protein